MVYEYPSFIADTGLSRLHVTNPPVDSAERETFRKGCDLGDHLPVVDFNEALRLHNEEGYRPCGQCLQHGGETSNWKERAERAEGEVASLKAQLSRLTPTAP